MKYLVQYGKQISVTLILVSFIVVFGHNQLLSTAYSDTEPSSTVPDSEGKIDFPQYNGLVDQISQEGAARVIIGLASSLEPLPSLENGGESRPVDIEERRRAVERLQERVLSQLNPQDVTDITQFNYIPFIALEVNAVALERLLQIPEVISIREVQRLFPTLSQSIPLIGADVAWERGYTGQGQTIAVLDTGVDKSHIFLSGKVVAEACFSTTISGRYTSLCPSGADTEVGMGAGVNCTANSDCAHGTHVAGIAAGKGDSFSGVAKDADLIAVQVFTRPVSSGRLTAFEDDLIQALEFVFDLRNSFSIASVNLSLGGNLYASSAQCDFEGQAFKAAIDNLRSVGIATVIASGNNSVSNHISYPGCISTAISVGATTASDQVASFSNSASWLSLLAPGDRITSSVPGGFAVFSGTSMATPHVAGAWAILKQSKPTATVEQILADLSESGIPVFDARNGITKPRIQISAVPGIKPLEITSGYLPYGLLGQAYSATVEASGGALSYTWSVIGGSLPNGLSLQSTTGVISGTPTQIGSWTLTIQVQDSTGNIASESYTIRVYSGPLSDRIWVEDSLPAGAVEFAQAGSANEPWTWISSNPLPVSGARAHQTGVMAGVHQHVFINAGVGLQARAGEILFAYVYLDATYTPSEVMLQWYDGTWSHRAYWGANLIAYGTEGTASRRYMGPLPALGQWVRLEAPAEAVGLVGTTVTGMAFTIYGGRATWDAAGKTSLP